MSTCPDRGIAGQVEVMVCAELPGRRMALYADFLPLTASAMKQ
jgi:hypothetical protein